MSRQPSRRNGPTWGPCGRCACVEGTVLDALLPDPADNVSPRGEIRWQGRNASSMGRALYAEGGGGCQFDRERSFSTHPWFAVPRVVTSSPRGRPSSGFGLVGNERSMLLMFINSFFSSLAGCAYFEFFFIEFNSVLFLHRDGPSDRVEFLGGSS